MGAVDERNLKGATAPREHEPVRVVLVRMPSRKRVPRTPAPPKRGRRRSPSLRSITKRSKKRMIKLAFILFVVFAVYVALGAVLPASGGTAIVFPALAAIPKVGGWLCYITYKGIACVAAFAALGKV
jgi:hypothetical protein